MTGATPVAPAPPEATVSPEQAKWDRIANSWVKNAPTRTTVHPTSGGTVMVLESVPFALFKELLPMVYGAGLSKVAPAFVDAVAVSSKALPATVKVFRVEGVANARIAIGEGGTVAVSEGERMLFLNFGSRSRAEEFFARRLAQGMDGAQMKSFEVPKKFLEELRSSAVPESMARQFPNSPIVVDPTKAADQFGIRAAQVEELQKRIIQGTGEIIK